ncbi:hypothetical protein GCM10022243_34160 [Saccharothrix violaceirubra]|uniref:Molecular chaperone n=1 Tax=Saccharothrix violaceirubra TaxID=413306 RepID=A0A7W7WWK3_9PSEU|nr:hypothetical protein [Saccharothrix violaceirubra]MBB4966469.1 hypothetical protein [Saccharothrix violaceirubra]
MPPRPSPTRQPQAPPPRSSRPTDRGRLPETSADSGEATRRHTEAYGGRAAFDLGTTTATVTVWDPQEATYPSLSPVQRRTLAEAFADLLDDHPAGTELSVAWRKFDEHLAEVLDPASDGTSAAGRLRHKDGHQAVLERVIVELERFRESGGRDVRRYLTPRLADCYARALAVPPLDSLRYYRAYLEGRAHDELPSVVWDTGAPDERRFRLGDPPEARDPVAYRGLKQQLGRHTPRLFGPEDGPAYDELMTGALRDLVYRTNRYLENFRTELALVPGRLVDAVVTYPTMASLSVRDTLRRMLRDVGILAPDTRFDEAVAAAMFYVLRSVGGRTDLAVEAFASRCDPVPGEKLTPDGRPTAWRQNVLIVDVGGGTVDVALIRLDLRDETDRSRPGADSPHYGRYFRLRPTLLGTTGESQRGGDFLTLQVFRWIKVLLADHLLTHRSGVAEAVRDQLGRRYYDAHDGYLPGKLVTSALESLADLRESARAAGHVVSTEWRDTTPGKPGTAAEREQLFGLLWTMAERVKKDLGTAESVAVDEIPLRTVFDAVCEMHSSSADGPLEAPRFLLRQRDFTRLVAPEVRQSLEPAADLVAARLAGDTLHQVVLTGRGSLLPLVRSELVRALADRRTGTEPVPPILGYGDEYAKHAASIGACWAATVDRRGQEHVLKRLAEGVTWLTVEVDNLLRSMRAAFVVPPNMAGSMAAIPLFGMDSELLPTEAGGEPVVRSDWVQYQNPFRVDRVKGVERSVQWTNLRLQEYYRRVLHRAEEDDLFVQVEAAASLEMWALVCRGGVPDIELPVHRESIPFLTAPFDAVPVDVLADPAIGGFLDDSRTEPVFRRDEPLDQVIVVGGERLRGRVGGPLDAPQAHGWRFYRSDGAGTDSHPVTVAAPPCAPGLRHYAVLDERGVLHVVAGPPPYRRADDLDAVLDSPGSVLRLVMTSAEPDYRAEDDPFTGAQ